jgi:hypothetical protein
MFSEGPLIDPKAMVDTSERRNTCHTAASARTW